MSRQSDYQARHIAQGLCRSCGQRPLHPESKCHCWLCGTKNRLRSRKANGCATGTFKIARPQSDLRQTK